MTEFNEKYPDPSYKSGWNPYEPFYPKDAFSKSIMISIIGKVSKWLENMQQETTGEFGELAWNYTPDGGTIVFANNSPDRFVQLWWDDEVIGESRTISICGSDKRFEDISCNLDFFTSVELRIYGELEAFKCSVDTQKDYAKAILANSPPSDLVDDTPPEPIILNADQRLAAEALKNGGI